MDEHDSLVRAAIARHLDVDPESVAPTAELERDLGLDALDLILIVLRLDELNDAEVAVADLEGIVTVADLAEVVRAWQSGPPTERTPLASGITPVAAEWAPPRVSKAR